MASIRSCAVIVLGASLVMAGCGREERPADETATAPVASDTSGPAAPAPQPAPRSSSLWAGGEAVPLDVQVAHPNGVVLQLTSLQSRETETVVGVRILNGNNNEVQLNRFNNRQGYIVVESGERIYISPPAGNTALAIQPGQTLEGELVFLGRLPRSQSAVLVLNENSATDNRFTPTPSFRIDLPLAGLESSGAVGEAS